MKLFVGSLPYQTTEEDLRELFEQFGAVADVKVIMDRETQRSRGFGFVEMSNPEEGKKAIETLDGSDMNGRAIVVNEARERPARR